jgi:hypothetical protein
MAIDLQRCAQMYRDKRDDDRGLESSLDPNQIPPTREPSPEPLWQNSGQSLRNGYNITEWIHASGQHIPTEPVAQTLCSNPSTRGWNEEHVFAQQDRFDGRHLPRTSSREPPVQRGYANAPATQPYQMVYVVPTQVVVPKHDATTLWLMNNGGGMPFPIQTWPTPQEAHEPSNVRMLSKEKSPTQPRQLPYHLSPASELQRSEISEQSIQAPAEHLKKSAKGKSAVHGKHGKGSNKLDTLPLKKSAKGKSAVHGKGSNKWIQFNILSEAQKDALCQYVYEFMVEKGFTSPDGYLVVDVFAELWKDSFFEDLAETPESWRVAHVRFSELLCSAPQLFEQFRKKFRVDKRWGCLDRRGLKMVRLVVKN